MSTSTARGTELSSQPSWWCVTNETLPYVWVGVEEIMKKHPKGLLDLYSLEAVKVELVKGEKTLWVGVSEGRIEAAMLTAVSEFTYAKHLFIIWVGGMGQKYLPVGVERMQQYCDSLGIEEMHFCGRPALKRLLEPFGFKSEQVMMTRRARPASVRSN